jgi:hypothetical protein
VIWAAVPLVLWLEPTFFGVFQPYAGTEEFIRHVGMVWLALGVAGLLFRMVQLFFLRGVQTGLVWATKIITDPFSDARLYYKAPLYLMRGELMDPMEEEEQRA